MQTSHHSTVFVNELKLSDFKQVLGKNGIASEFSGGVLWCSNGTVALRRVRLNFKKDNSSFRFKIVGTNDGSL